MGASPKGVLPHLVLSPEGKNQGPRITWAQRPMEGAATKGAKRQQFVGNSGSSNGTITP
jgi:hypothetical protein